MKRGSGKTLGIIIICVSFFSMATALFLSEWELSAVCGAGILVGAIAVIIGHVEDRLFIKREKDLIGLWRNYDRRNKR